MNFFNEKYNGNTMQYLRRLVSKVWTVTWCYLRNRENASL